MRISCGSLEGVADLSFFFFNSQSPVFSVKEHFWGVKNHLDFPGKSSKYRAFVPHSPFCLARRWCASFELFAVFVVFWWFFHYSFTPLPPRPGILGQGSEMCKESGEKHSSVFLIVVENLIRNGNGAGKMRRGTKLKVHRHKSYFANREEYFLLRTPKKSKIKEGISQATTWFSRWEVGDIVCLLFPPYNTFTSLLPRQTSWVCLSMESSWCSRDDSAWVSKNTETKKSHQLLFVHATREKMLSQNGKTPWWKTIEKFKKVSLHKFPIWKIHRIFWELSEPILLTDLFTGICSV